MESGEKGRVASITGKCSSRQYSEVPVSYSGQIACVSSERETSVEFFSNANLSQDSNLKASRKGKV